MSSKFFAFIVFVLVVAFGIYYYQTYKTTNTIPQQDVSTKTPAKPSEPDNGESPEDLCKSQGGTYEYSVNECVLPLIIVSKPADNSLITSPLSVSGKARGYWYFEASFPIEITDSSGKVLATSHASAVGDWMTKEYVPFTGSISFKAPVGGDTRGFVIFKKDNPSGLPENDDSVKISIRFR